MFYKNSDSFEEAIFGRCSGDHGYIPYNGGFSSSVAGLIRRDRGQAYPETRLGKLLYFGLYHELERLGVNTEGLMIGSARKSEADFSYFTDGYIYLPAVPHTPVTLDAFNLDSEICAILKNRWEGVCSGEADFQTCLFMYKKGMKSFLSEGGIKGAWQRILNPTNHPLLGERPVNHFVLTPYYTEFRQNRRVFVKMVAGYFAQVAKVSPPENLALLSH